MPKPIIETTTDGYRLTVNGESSEVVPFGSPLEVELGGETWLCFIDLPPESQESTDTESVLANWLYKVEPVADDQIEFVDSDDDGDGDPDDDGDEDGDLVTVPPDEEEDDEDED